jgi:phosphatidylserine/phosphatidylglycerophosphate/cardiolipin synthase-like enzyme
MNDFITNGTEIKQRIISEINNSVQCIYLAMAYFTDRDIANAIIESKFRGVFVDVILSSNQQNQNIKSLFLDAGIKVHSFDTGDARGIMHHKFCLIDNKIVMNGSFNYSYNASTNNVENIQVSDNLSTYTQFHDEFERLKYNIDNNLDLNEVNQMPKIEEVLQPMNPVETFLKQLNFLVFSSSELDTEVYKKNGYEKSKENLGNIDIFRTEYIDIKEQLRTFATNNRLGSKKNILSTNISNVFENAKSKIEQEK